MHTSMEPFVLPILAGAELVFIGEDLSRLLLVVESVDLADLFIFPSQAATAVQGFNVGINGRRMIVTQSEWGPFTGVQWSAFNPTAGNGFISVLSLKASDG